MVQLVLLLVWQRTFHLYPRGVNRATTPYVGLPDSTVQLIRRDGAAVLVDWVRVTQDPAR
jgi:hypothetical protein